MVALCSDVKSWLYGGNMMWSRLALCLEFFWFAFRIPLLPSSVKLFPSKLFKLVQTSQSTVWAGYQQASQLERVSLDFLIHLPSSYCHQSNWMGQRWIAALRIEICSKVNGVQNNLTSSRKFPPRLLNLVYKRCRSAGYSLPSAVLGMPRDVAHFHG